MPGHFVSQLHTEIIRSAPVLHPRVYGTVPVLVVLNSRRLVRGGCGCPRCGIEREKCDSVERQTWSGKIECHSGSAYVRCSRCSNAALGLAYCVNAVQLAGLSK